MTLFDFLVFFIPDRSFRLRELPTPGDGRWWWGAAALALAALLALLQSRGAVGR